MTTPFTPGNPVRQQSMDRLSSAGDSASSGLPDLAGSGFHMPPEVLGRSESGEKEAPVERKQSKSTITEVNSRARRRSQLAVRATQSQAAAAAAAAFAINPKNSSPEGALDASMFTHLTYYGLDIAFVSTSSGTLVGVCSRTHMIHQTLNLASDTPVVSITSNSISGMLVVAHQDGTVQTYHPVSANNYRHKKDFDSQDMPQVTFRKFLWVDSSTIHTGKIFGSTSETIKFGDRRSAQPGELVDVSSCVNDKLLIAHKNQLAVFDARRPEPSARPSTPSNSGRLLWTTVLPSNIRAAKLSGDGQAIVVVLDSAEEDGTVGARTFVHDVDDGSTSATPQDGTTPATTTSVGIVYRPGPFLPHSKPIVRISFRGLGFLTSSSTSDIDQGNDLLLTFCAEDSTLRIFNQNGWRQLMMWVAPPNSRADWIKGSSAFNLGDLEARKKGSSGSRAPSRRPSGTSSTDTAMTGGINAGLRSSRMPGASASTGPSGAWIAEITFRGAFPALRLSRLSYISRGNGMSPAHFESIAAILPAGSLVAGGVSMSDDMGLSIHGLWPAWDPWLSESVSDKGSETLSGSAMQFLGLSSTPSPNTQHFGDSYSGGTHSPPTELRITASHPQSGKLIVMEFPLWGDDDFGAMELGSPIRSVLSLSDSAPCEKRIDRATKSSCIASMYHDTSHLSAIVCDNKRSISLLWRKLGSASVHVPERKISRSLAPQLMEDKSCISAPLALPPLHLPKSKGVALDTIVAMRWLPDTSFDGPPLLLVVTRSSSLVVYEVPPPRSIREPSMPNFDPLDESNDDNFEFESPSRSNSMMDASRSEYTVNVTPHPDFGLGLRLESPMDGFPAVAGTFKKHPLNGGMLPAERTGMIVLGDEVLSVNGVSLENMTFDDIIATVRHVGAEAGPGQPLALRFRPSTTTRGRRNSAALEESFRAQPLATSPEDDADASVNRRDVIGLDGQKRQGDFAHERKPSDVGSLLLMDKFGRDQQEFGRIIGVVKGAVSLGDEADAEDRFCVIPWGNGAGSPSSNIFRCAALVIYCADSKVFAKRLEIPSTTEEETIRFHDLGSVDISDTSEDSSTERLCSIQHIPGTTQDHFFAVSDSLGTVRLVRLEVQEKDSSLATFHVSKLFCMGVPKEKFVLLAESITMFAAFEHSKTDEHHSTVQLWSARADPSCRKQSPDAFIKDRYFGQDYVKEEIEIIPAEGSPQVKGMQFLQTGFLDAFPTLVVYLEAEMIVLQRRGGHSRWRAVCRISYSRVPTSCPAKPSRQQVPSGSPLDTFPHLPQMLQSTLISVDESNYLVSDWQPQSLLAYLCVDERGAKTSLTEHVRKIILWLADCVDTSMEGSVDPASHLSVAPFDRIGGEKLLSPNEESSAATNSHSAFSLMTSYTARSTGGMSETDQEKAKLEHLLSVLGEYKRSREPVSTAGKSLEFQLAMASNKLEAKESVSIPSFLSSRPLEELRVLWAIISIINDTPEYKSLDSPGQLALTIFSLHGALKDSPEGLKRPVAQPSGGSKMSMLVPQRKSSSDIRRDSLPPQASATASIAAMMSDYQGLLLERIRRPGKKLSWNTVRDLRMAFWIRSDDTLRQIAEEVGQRLYMESRDILQAAVFFLAAGKKRTLRNLAAADNSDSGKKFYKFLMGFDFSSDRGRSAAEKNAFSLLRKNKYDSAAAFFLLAEPPILRSAVETIAGKMGDLELAFMVSRLVGNAEADGRNSSAIGGGMAFGGILGGGGGYVGSGIATIGEIQKDATGFSDWHPRLSKGTKDLLRDRLLPKAQHDSAFSATIHYWLGTRDEAHNSLSGYIKCQDTLFPSFVEDFSLPRLNDVDSHAKSSQDPTITMTNSFIDFVSGPGLLKALGASSRTRIASTLLVSRSLCGIGVELPALCSLAQNADIEQFIDSTEIDRKKRRDASEMNNSAGGMTSSIFDSFDNPPARQEGKKPNKNDPMTSSIFDNFASPSPSGTSGVGNAGTAVSSIFDDFEPAAKKAPVPADSMTSSIFDSFAPPPTPKPKSEQAASSIFDSFDVQSQKPTHQTQSIEVATGQVGTSGGHSVGTMNSSIFDSFAPAPKPKTEQVQSSIFDSFDVPSQKPKASVSAVGEETSPAEASDDEKAKADLSTEPLRATPLLWQEWRQHLYTMCASRRFLRHIASVSSRFHSGSMRAPFSTDGSFKSLRVPDQASQVLQFHAESEEILSDIQRCLSSLSSTFGISEETIVNGALKILDSPFYNYRVCFAILLHLSINETELAEDIVRVTAQSLMEMSTAAAASNDDICVTGKISKRYSTYSRQSAANLSWQLELCLWMHRGGILPLSGLALNEAICGVRLGLLVASWNTDFEVVETIVRQAPDCAVDDSAGRQLWASLKVISSKPTNERKGSKTSSGGWEFLVDCRRAEATEMLRDRTTGCFIIRPHPEDHGVFTLSFKTNLVPTKEGEETSGNQGDSSAKDDKQRKSSSSRTIKRDDVVQHAIIRLSDSGFRCGSFGPFGTLMKLLEAVSSSLPFSLRFDKPPTEGVIKEEGSKPSPNSSLFRKIGLLDGNRMVSDTVAGVGRNEGTMVPRTNQNDGSEESYRTSLRKEQFGMFTELLVLSTIRRQLSAVAAVHYNAPWAGDDVESVDSLSNDSKLLGPEQEYAIAARTLRPFLTWCRMAETEAVRSLAPLLTDLPGPTRTAVKEVADSVEPPTAEKSLKADGGDSIVRRMIQPDSGVTFKTLRLGDGGESAMVVLFSKNEAMEWFLNNGIEDSEEDALLRLDAMESNRVIEPVDLHLLATSNDKKPPKEGEESDKTGTEAGLEIGIRYRLVDPWEVEPLESREAETRGAQLGRHAYLAFDLGVVASSCEDVFRSTGGLHMLELWATARGGVSLTKAFATVHAPWERASGGDLLHHDGEVVEVTPFENSIRQHLYRNSLFRRLHLPQRFLALIQVELLDLKNLTSPGGSLSLTVYSLLRLKRPRSNAPLTMKARTLDSVATHPVKLGKATGPNAPASWGSLVRFRFPMPEHTAPDGRSYDSDREALFKGAPSVLQLNVYEKKFMSDTLLGGADVSLDGLSSGGQLEEWVPLRTETHGINWFARIRLTLRFELMCLTPPESSSDGIQEAAPSVGLRRIKALSTIGGIQEDVRRSASTPDLLSYFESMVY